MSASTGGIITSAQDSAAQMTAQTQAMIKAQEITSTTSMITNQEMQNENNKVENAKKNQDALNKTQSEIAGDKVQ